MQDLFSHLKGEPEAPPSFASSHLSFLPPEVIAPITDLLSPMDITRLWETGSRKLMKTMALGGVQNFHLVYEVSGDRRWPEIVSKFRRLRTLVIIAPFGVSFSKINLQGLAPTLKTLKLTFNEAESCWYLPPGRTVRQLANAPFKADMLNVSELLPEIESLELAGAFHVSNHFVASLPKTATNISIQTIDDMRPAGTPTFFSQEGLDHLPPFLSRLALHGYMPWTPEDIEKLPRELLSLELVGTANLDDECLLALPRTLTHLGFSFTKKSPISNQGLSFLPSTLQSLDLRNCEKLLASSFAVLPVNLTSLKIGGPDMVIDVPEAKQLPRGLTSLDFNNVEIRSNNAFTAFPRYLLRLLVILRSRHYISDGCASMLPPSLTYLYLACPERHAVSWNDRFLERLACRRTLRTLHLSPHNGLTDVCAPFLPRTLTDLDLGYAIKMTETTLAALPPDLTRLNVRSWNWFSTAQIQMLPRKLDTLILNQSGLITNDSLRALPPKLTHLELQSSPLLTDEAFQYLPAGLRVLYLPGSNSITEECTRHLPPSITSLKISDCQAIIYAKAHQPPAAINADLYQPLDRRSNRRGWLRSLFSWITPFGYQ